MSNASRPIEEEVSLARTLIALTVEFNKMMIPVAIGGIAIAAPYTFGLIAVANLLKSTVGSGIAAVGIFVFLMVTAPALAMLTIGAVMIVEQLVPWSTWEGSHAYP